MYVVVHPCMIRYILVYKKCWDSQISAWNKYMVRCSMAPAIQVLEISELLKTISSRWSGFQGHRDSRLKHRYELVHLSLGWYRDVLSWVGTAMYWYTPVYKVLKH